MAAGDKADLILWPETSFPGYLEDEPVMAAHLRNLVRQARAYVLVGAPTLGDLEEGLRFFNSGILYGPNGEERKRYSKKHLVPFGEYIPLEPVLGFIRHFVTIGHFTAGSEWTVFELRSLNQAKPIRAKFATLICYEDIFPGLVRSFCQNGADFLVNITNDAWFGKTAAPYQHAQASVFRAVENRVPVIRATNTGYSCFISAEGRILASVQDRGETLNVTGHQTQDITLRRGKSFYTEAGDVFMLFLGLLIVLAYRERNKTARYERF
jgi:apolipoprotein N-acyltransferase